MPALESDMSQFVQVCRELSSRQVALSGRRWCGQDLRLHTAFMITIENPRSSQLEAKIAFVFSEDRNACVRPYLLRGPSLPNSVGTAKHARSKARDVVMCRFDLLWTAGMLYRSTRRFGGRVLMPVAELNRFVQTPNQPRRFVGAFRTSPGGHACSSALAPSN